MCQKHGGTPPQKSCRQLQTSISYHISLPRRCKRKLAHRRKRDKDSARGTLPVGIRRGRLSVIAPIAHGPLPRSRGQSVDNISAIQQQRFHTALAHQRGLEKGSVSRESNSYLTARDCADKSGLEVLFQYQDQRGASAQWFPDPKPLFLLLFLLLLFLLLPLLLLLLLLPFLPVQLFPSGPIPD